MASSSKAQKREQLIIALDTSVSMREFPLPSGMTGLQVILPKIENALRQLATPTSIQLYVFSDELSLVGEYDDAQQALNGLHGIDCLCGGGSSRLWDSLARLLKNVSESEPCTILCGTDGQDCWSNSTRRDVDALLAQRKRTKLTILDLSSNGLPGSVPKSGNDGGITILNASTGSDVDEHLLSIFACKKRVRNPLNIPVAVIALCECNESDVRAVCSAIRQSVPYLEDLTGLRYYPAPTYIVNSQQMQMLSPNKQAPTNVCLDPEMGSDAREIIRFVKAIALSFHTRCFIPTGIIDGWRDYIRFTKLSNSSLKRLVEFGETFGGLLEEYLTDGKIKSTREIHIPELSSMGDLLIDSEANMHEIARILQRLSDEYPNQILLKDEYFYERCNVPPLYRCGGPTPNMDAWRRRLLADDMTTVARAIESGSWTLRLEDMIEVFEIALNVLFPILAGLTAIKSGVSEIRTLGLYVPPDSPTQQRLSSIFNDPSMCIAQDTTGGKVFIDIERYSSKVWQTASGADLNAFARQVLTSVVLHEHAHAITREGQPFSSDQTVDHWTSVPSETLAEWAELDFFRDDPHMLSAILHHAGSGALPNWPYAGALWFEKQRIISFKRAYRSLVKLLRTSPDEAFDKVMSWPEILQK